MFASELGSHGTDLGMFGSQMGLSLTIATRFGSRPRSEFICHQEFVVKVADVQQN